MRERFTEFGRTNDTEGGGRFVRFDEDLLLDFIKQELKKEREEIVEMIEQINPEPSAWKDSLDGFKAVIINTIKNRV